MRELSDIVELFNYKKREVADIIKANLANELSKFMKANPDIKFVYWTQYAPGFNDGDPCVFHIWDIYHSTKYTWEEIQHMMEEQGEHVDSVELPGEEYLYMSDHPAITELGKFLKLLEDDFLEGAIGSDAEVILTPTQLIVNGYDHD